MLNFLRSDLPNLFNMLGDVFEMDCDFIKILVSERLKSLDKIFLGQIALIPFF